MLISTSGAFFGPLNNTERPDAERPEENRINDSPPVPPHRDDENEDHGGFNQPNSRRGEEREEELNHDDDRAAPLQQFLPPNVGMDWRQQGAAVEIPVYYPLPYADPYAFPIVFPNAYPYALLNALPHALPYANPFAPPYVRPYVPPNANPFAFAYDPPYLPPYTPRHAAPYVPPYAAPHAFPYAAPPANPALFHADPHGVLEQLIARNQHERLEQDPGIDAIGVDEEDEIVIPELEVFGLGYPETIGPLTTAECLGFFRSDSSLEEEAVVPSTSGLSSATRRSREESDEKGAVAKRPRWSDESDSD